jgi:hypothetical protein
VRTPLIIAIALAAVGWSVPVFAQAPEGSTPQAAGAPAPAPIQALPPGQPASPYPPGYGYPPPGYGYPPPGYGYPPPGYAYPPPGYAYPPGYGYPPGYAPYPPGYPAYPRQYGAPVVAAAATPPFQPPTGKIRLSAEIGIFAGGRLKYDLSYRGGSIFAHSGSAAATPGFSILADFQPLRYVFAGLSVQYLTTVKWSQTNYSASSTSSSADLYGGSGYEVDFLPRLGISYPMTSRIRVLASGAPGYSLINASSMVKAYADPGTVGGFVVQADGGMIVSFSTHGFVQARISYQWGYQKGTVQSRTTSETATAYLHSSYLGLHAGAGYWF